MQKQYDAPPLSVFIPASCLYINAPSAAADGAFQSVKEPLFLLSESSHFLKSSDKTAAEKLEQLFE